MQKIKKPTYYVYILECADKTLYTGITTDLLRRLHEHNNSPKGAKYTKSRRPVHLLYKKNTKPAPPPPSTNKKSNK